MALSRIHLNILPWYSRISPSAYSFTKRLCQKSSVNSTRYQACQDVGKMDEASYSLNTPTPPSHSLHYDEDMSFIHIGDFNVYPWSISGLGTSVIVNRDKMTVAFDIGYASREASWVQYVFISHGHTDHTMGLTHHASKREMTGMVPATYYMPPNLVTPLTTVCEQFSQMQGSKVLDKLDIRGCSPGQTIQLPWNRYAKPFPTLHRVPSQGYLLYHRDKIVKRQYEDLFSYQLTALQRKGIDIHNEFIVPEIAYTGDTTFEVFMNPPNPDLLKVKLLITEATFVDDDVDRKGRSSIRKAEETGHIHLRQICENADLFKNVENILLIHFSDKYTVQYIRDKAQTLLPPSLKNKIYLGLTAQELYLGLGASSMF